MFKKNEIKQITKFKKNKIIQTYTNKPSTTIFCPTCNIPMLLCQYFGGGIYWVCDNCGCKAEITGL